jgi:hypothetical protein
MRASPSRAVIRVRGCVSARGVVLLVAAFTVQTTSGCLSNEYRIQKDELGRLAAVPPEARGQSVRVSQTLGERRTDAVEPSVPVVVDEVASEPSGDVSLQINSGGELGAGPRHAGFRAPPSGGVGAAPSGAFRGVRPPGGGHAPSGGGGGGSLFHGSPTGGGFSMPSGGGGGNDGAVLVVVAVVVIAAATLATVALAACEGMRFEGHAQVAPEQLLYLERGGETSAVPLDELTSQQAAAADSALVMDDEGYGLRRLDHAPLDRKGGLFRFDLGAGMFTFGDGRASGVSAHVQAGAFFTHTFGLVVDAGLGVGTPDPCCSGALAATGSISRHSLGLEAEWLPLGLGPVHLGAFAGGGVALAAASGPYEAGPMASGGALFELDLTSHLALSVRGGANTAWLPIGRSSAGAVTGGLAIY